MGLRNPQACLLLWIAVPEDWRSRGIRLPITSLFWIVGQAHLPQHICAVKREITEGFVQIQYHPSNRNLWPLLATWSGQRAMRRKSYRVVSFPILYKHGTWASPVLRLLEKAPIRKTVRSKPVTGCLLQGLKIAPERTKVILWSLIHLGVWKAKFEPFLGFS